MGYVAAFTGPARALAAHCRKRAKIAANTFRDTATSTIWKIPYRECVTTFAPILMNR